MRSSFFRCWNRTEPSARTKTVIRWFGAWSPAARIAQEGVTVNAFPAGTILTVTLHPLRDGRPFGSLVDGEPLIKCETTLPENGCTEETGEIFLVD